MSDTPIFDKMNEFGRYDEALDRRPNGKTASGSGFFVRVEKARNGDILRTPDPYLDGPIHLIGAQDAQTEVLMVEEDDDEIYIAPSSPVTSLVSADVDPEVVDHPTHEFPVVNLQGLSSGEVPNGLHVSDWAQGLLRASAPIVVQNLREGGKEPQTGFNSLLDRIMSDARAEVAKVEDERSRPKEIVLAEMQMHHGSNLSAQGSWQSCLDFLQKKAARDFPRHVPTGVVRSDGDDAITGCTLIKLVGVEGALPIYNPVEEGDTLGEGRNDRFHDNRSENVISLVEAAPDEDPAPEYPFSLPKPLFEHTEEHDEE